MRQRNNHTAKFGTSVFRFKLIPEGASDVVRVTLIPTPADPQRDPTLPFEAFDPAKVTFISAEGMEYKAKPVAGKECAKIYKWGEFILQCWY